MAKGFSVEMQEILSDYSSEVKGVYRAASKDAAKKTAKRLQGVTHPRLTGDYARGWTVTQTDADTYVVHNKTEYRLTHLLENGHVSANQYGSGYKRVAGIKHIEPAEQEGIKTFEDDIRKGLQ